MKPKKFVQQLKNCGLKVLEGMEKANKINKVREFYTIAHGMKAGFQPQMSVQKERYFFNFNICTVPLLLFLLTKK